MFTQYPRVLACAVLVPLLGLGCKSKETPQDPAAPSRASEAAPVPSGSGQPKAPAETEEKSKLERPSEKLNVIFITIDALRADMPWTGYPKPIAPHLSKLAEEGVVYENHRSVSSYTAQTVATFLSGRYASTLYRTGMFFTNYSLDNDWITESMQAAQIRTLAVHAHLYFDRAPGLKQGFDEWKMVPGLTWNSATDESVTSPKSIDAMVELCKDPKNTAGQFFLWAHLMDPHDKYVKHDEAPDFGDKNRGRYDSEVWYTDYHLGKFLEFAKSQPWWSKTALIVSADHGESFGDHEMFKHAFELWEDLVRVPLVVVAPGASPRRISEARNHVDIGPTIVDLMGLPPLESFQGKSLVPELYGAPAPSREPILLELAEDTNNAHRQAIVSGDHKLILFETGKAELYDIKNDPGETRDLAKEDPKKTSELLAQLKTGFAALPRVEPYGGAKLKSGKSASGPSGKKSAAKGN
jgi:choline-sulfatase